MHAYTYRYTYIYIHILLYIHIYYYTHIYYHEKKPASAITNAYGSPTLPNIITKNHAHIKILIASQPFGSDQVQCILKFSL